MKSLIVYYGVLLVSAAIISGITFGLSAFSAPLWAQIGIGLAVFPVYAVVACTYCACFAQVWVELFKEQKDD